MRMIALMTALVLALTACTPGITLTFERDGDFVTSNLCTDTLLTEVAHTFTNGEKSQDYLYDSIPANTCQEQAFVSSLPVSCSAVGWVGERRSRSTDDDRPDRGRP